MSGAWFKKEGDWSLTGLALSKPKRRFFVLEGQELRYYQDIENGMPKDKKGIISLLDADKVGQNGRQLLIVSTCGHEFFYHGVVSSNLLVVVLC